MVKPKNRHERRHGVPVKLSPLKRAEYTIIDVKTIRKRPYERDDGTTGFAPIDFPCSRILLQNLTTQQIVRVGYSRATDELFTVTTVHGEERKMARATFVNYAKERFGSISDLIVDFLKLYADEV